MTRTEQASLPKDDQADVALIRYLLRNFADTKTEEEIFFGEDRDTRLKILTKLIKKVFDGIEDKQVIRMANLFLDKTDS